MTELLQTVGLRGLAEGNRRLHLISVVVLAVRIGVGPGVKGLQGLIQNNLDMRPLRSQKTNYPSTRKSLLLLLVATLIISASLLLTRLYQRMSSLKSEALL